MWDAFQRDVLDALGHTLYRQRGLAEAPVPGEPMAGAGASRQPVAGRVSAGLPGAIARAAGIAPERLAIELPDLPSPQSLRGDAVAKRALWPRLRALRASTGAE